MAKNDDEKAAESVQKAVQKVVDEAEEKGYLGARVDPTPNEHYTVAGVTSGKPTPETDEDAADAAAKHGQRLARGLSK